MSEIHVAFCCEVCRKVKDEHVVATAGHEWCTISEYAKRHLVHAEDIRLSTTYCPDCTASYDRLMLYGRGSIAPSA